MDKPLIKSRKKFNNYSRSENIFIYLVMVIMLLVPFSVWWLYVNWSSLFLSFQCFEGGEDSFYYGFENFRVILSIIGDKNSQVFLALKNTLIFFAEDILVLFPLTYIMSFFLYKKIYGYKFFKFVFFMPTVISAVVLTSFYKFALGPYGPITRLVEIITGERLLILNNSKTAMSALLVYNLWTIGPGFVLWVANFSRIPDEVIEYARLDGITWFKEMCYIIFPLTFPFFAIQLFMKFTGIFGASGPILLLTGGGYKTTTLSYWFFINTLDTPVSQARAASMGIMLSLISTPIALLIRAFTNRIDTVEY